MGWASGVYIFDAVVETTLGLLEGCKVDSGDPSVIQAVVKEMYSKVDWDDWDTQEESEYFKPYLLEAMNELDQLHENEYAWHKAGQPDDWDWTNKGW